jgi:tetratricopeptide (TPR) repeat protein
MRRKALSLLLVLLTAAPAAAQTVDTEKLRAAASMPRIALQMDLGFRSGDLEQRDAEGKRIDFPAKLAALQKRLDGTVRDAEAYLEIAACYDGRTDKAKILAAARKAEQLLRPHLQTTGPAVGPLLAQYCGALSFLEDTVTQDQEKWARQAVKQAPQDWRCWAQLGSVRNAQFFQSLYRDDKGPARFIDDVFADLLRRKPAPAAVAEAEKCLQEARRCYDMVRALAPRGPGSDHRALMACFTFARFEPKQQQVLSALRGQPVEDRPIRDQLAARDALALAEACPKHMPCQAQAAITELTLALAKVLPSGSCDKLPTLLPQDRQALQQYLDRLAAGTTSPDAEVAAYCHRALAILHFMLQDLKTSAMHARRAVELNGRLQEMREVLAFSLFDQHQRAAALEVARACLKRYPTPRNHFLLAKLLVDCDRLGEAEQPLREGLGLDPKDVYCNLGLAAILILRNNEADTLAEAGKHLGIAMDLRRDFVALAIISKGLEGRTGPRELRDALSQLLTHEEETPELRKIREALGP